MQIRVMTVKQPWATLLAIGAKPVENRSRWTPPRWAMESRAPVWIAIHASGTRAPLGDYEAAIVRADGTRQRFDEVGPAVEGARRDWPVSAVVGAARFVGWMDRVGFFWAASSRPADHFDGESRYFDSPWRVWAMHGILFADAVEFCEPIPGVRGYQSVWWRPDGVLSATIRDRLAVAQEAACAAA